uniref:Ig-like domain-containing protein n=1 Tax=Nothobranchius furzeri TaxID=105023 RepID=A0A8C6KCJ5_NOTFU
HLCWPFYKLQLQKAVAGQESVSLPCKTKTRLPLDATVEWRRIDTDTVVYTYPNNVQHDHAQHESYQECTEMIENPLRTGDLTLTLLGPCPSDSGLYVCTVLKEGRKLKQKIVSLTVEGQLELSVGFQMCQKYLSFMCIHYTSDFTFGFNATSASVVTNRVVTVIVDNNNNRLVFKKTIFSRWITVAAV